MSNLPDRLSSKKPKSSAFNNEGLSSLVEVTNFILATKAADEVIICTVIHLESYEKAPEVARMELDKKLRTKHSNMTLHMKNW